MSADDGHLMSSMDADDAAPIDEAAEIGEILFPIVRVFLSVAAVAIAAAAVLALYPITLGVTP